MTQLFMKTTPSTGAIAMYLWKEHMKSAGCTVPRSSDGTTYNGAADILTSGSPGAGGLANNNAWFALRFPSGVELAFQRGTTNLLWKVKRTHSGGFSGGSPGATQMGVAANEGIITGGGTDAAPTFITLFAADGTYRWNAMADNASPYSWWAGAFPIGGGTPNSGMVGDVVLASDALDADPRIQMMMQASAFTLASVSNALGTPTALPFFAAQVPSAAPTGAYASFAAARYDDASGAVIAPGSMVTNPASAKDETFPLFHMRRAALASPGFKGVASMLRWNGTTRATGDTLSVVTSRDRIVYGDCSLPWDGSVPTV